MLFTLLVTFYCPASLQVVFMKSLKSSPKYPSKGDWLNKLWYKQTVENGSLWKKNWCHYLETSGNKSGICEKASCTLVPKSVLPFYLKKKGKDKTCILSRVGGANKNLIIVIICWDRKGWVKLSFSLYYIYYLFETCC